MNNTISKEKKLVQKSGIDSDFDGIMVELKFNCVMDELIRKSKIYAMKTVTITFGDQAENHAGMQKIGKLADCGFTFEDLKEMKEEFEEMNTKCELVDLNIDETNVASAAILIIRNGVNAFVNSHRMYDEHNSLKVDTKAFMRGRVVNKIARYNLCFDEKAQEPDYENGKGRIIAFNDIPLTDTVRKMLPMYIGAKGKGLKGEGNYYYDVNKCYIGFHGDSERRKVVALRLGASMPLHYQWYRKSEPIGKRMTFVMNHGDMYVMGEKAVGFDWKKKLVPTLRHAAGFEKVLKI